MPGGKMVAAIDAYGFIRATVNGEVGLFVAADAGGSDRHRPSYGLFKKTGDPGLFGGTGRCWIAIGLGLANLYRGNKHKGAFQKSDRVR